MKHEKTMTQSHDDEILPDKNSLELLCNTFDESEIKCPFWRTGQTMRYLEFGGVDFKCDYCDCSFCEFDKLTEFLASHCHDYEECIYYRKNKDNAPDDYSECSDVPIPAQTDTTVAAFDYSELDPDTAAKLEDVTAEIFNVRKEYIFTMAKKVAYAHDLLANCGNGKFGAWCESIGISRFTGNNLIKIVELFNNSTLEEQENLNKLTDGNIKLLYEAARPSAPPELVEQVKSGDITTHKDFIALKKQLEAANKQLEDAKFHSKQQSESFDRVAKQSDVNYKKYLDEMHKNQDLTKQIRELESRPVDVAVPDDEEIDRMARERAQGLLRAKDNEWQKRMDEVQLQLRKAEQAAFDAAFEANAPDTEQIREFYEYLHGNALSAIKSCFDFVRGDKVTGSTAADIKARLRTLKEIINDYLEEMK